MKALGVAMGATGVAPTPDQLAEMESLGKSVAQGGQITAVLMALALVAMSVAQYISF